MAEPKKEGQEVDEVEEEYVMLDLDTVAQHIRIPENAPYVLTGLDTPNPILMIDTKIKLIGEYTETIGTCLVFNANDAEPDNGEEEEVVGPSEAKKTPDKKINPTAQLTKVLRFKPCLETGGRDAASKPC